MNTLSRWLERSSLYIALLAAWVATLGSLYFSEVAGFVPCTLCWYQRILMYPLALILLIGLLRWDANLPVLVLPFSLLGLGTATYHYLLEKTHLFPSHAVCQAGVSCTTAWINWFGFVTIPFLSLLGFLTITVMTAIALGAGQPYANEEPVTPWLPVVAIPLATLTAFALLTLLNRPAQESAALFPIADSCAADAQSRVVPTTTGDAELIQPGARLYAEACAGCHGVDGEGTTTVSSPLLGAERLRTATDAELVSLIRAGLPAGDPTNRTGIAMPPSGGRPDLTDEQLLAIISYLRTKM